MEDPYGQFKLTVLLVASVIASFYGVRAYQKRADRVLVLPFLRPGERLVAANSSPARCQRASSPTWFWRPATSRQARRSEIWISCAAT